MIVPPEEEENDDEVQEVFPQAVQDIILSQATNSAGVRDPSVRRWAYHGYNCHTADPFSYRPNQSLYFIVRGRPKPKPRALYVRHRRINPVAAMEREFAKCCENLIRNKLGTVPHWSGHLKMTVKSFFDAANGGLTMLGDCNNLANFCQDALEGLLFGNDGQVTYMKAMKGYDSAYGGKGYTVIMIHKRVNPYYDY
jgi:hypothetical protein